MTSKPLAKAALKSREWANRERGTMVEPMTILQESSTQQALYLTERYPIALPKADLHKK